MKMQGVQKIPASRTRVWAALNDPDILRQSITGCQQLAKTSDNSFEAKVVAKVGPVKATFTGDVTLSNLNPPESYRISGQGKGGAAGFAKGGAAVKLDETDDGTVLSYDVDAQVGGKLAQIGSRLIDAAAKKMAGDFFRKFAKIVASDIEIAGEKTMNDKSEPATGKTPAKKTAAKKTAAKKTAAKKTAAKKAPAKKTAARKTTARTAGARTSAAVKSVESPTAAARSAQAPTAAAAPPEKAAPDAATRAPASPSVSQAPATGNGRMIWWVVIAAAVLALLLVMFN